MTDGRRPGDGSPADALVAQQEEIRDVLSLVLGATGAERQALWNRTRELLARHGAAAPDPGQHRIAEMVEFVDRFAVDSIAFDTQFRELQEEVFRHLEEERSREVPLLQETADGGAPPASAPAAGRSPAARIGSAVRAVAARLLPG